MSLEIRGGVVISPGQRPQPATVRVEDGRIGALEAPDCPRRRTGAVVDAGGAWVLPGFVDIHTHGAAGASAMDGTGEAMRVYAQAKLREGVTTFLPSTWTASSEDLIRAARGVQAYRQRMDFARVPGIHVEGPFINPACLGAQNPAHVRSPCIEEIDRLARETPVLIVSLAVEMEGGLEMVRQLKERGIISSLAHTAATYERFQTARLAGLSHLTHFCNQMTPMHHRAIGIVGAGLLDDGVRIEVIGDGLHLCPDMLRLVFRAVPEERILLITDSISASGMPDGEYGDGGLPVIVKNGICRLHNGALAGSTLRFNQALQNIVQITGKPVEDIVPCVAWNQAVSLGLDRTGKVEPGYVADLAILDALTYEVRTVLVGGEVRWQAN